jgi:hypothetical protein
MKKGRAKSSGGGLIFLLIPIILIIVAYLYHNQILAYIENNEMFQSVKNGIVQFINESQQAFNIIQNSLNENVSLNNSYTSNTSG